MKAAGISFRVSLFFALLCFSSFTAPTHSGCEDLSDSWLDLSFTTDASADISKINRQSVTIPSLLDFPFKGYTSERHDSVELSPQSFASNPIFSVILRC